MRTSALVEIGGFGQRFGLWMTLPTLTCVGPPVFAAPDWAQRRREEALSGTDEQTVGA